MIEFHGNLFDTRCSSCSTPAVADESLELPTCPACGGNLRPGVVWFGESIPEAALNDSCAAASDCDVFLSIGTSSLVYPAAGLANLALENDALVVEINPDPTMHASKSAIAIAGKSGRMIPELISLLTL